MIAPGPPAARPEPFSVIATELLWTDPHVSEQMLRLHLDPTVDVASRRPEAIDAAVAWTTAAFSLGPGSSVLDLGCGPGLYTSRWAATGADVTGVDFSARSIAYARAAARLAGHDVHYVQADYLEWRSDRRHDLVTLIMCDFSALAPFQRSRLLANAASWLAPDGAFLFDVCAAPFLAPLNEGSARVESAGGDFWSATPHAVVSERVIYREARVLLDRYTIEEPSHTWTVWNWLQVYDPESLAQVLAPAGLRVEAVLGDVAGRTYDAGAPEFAVVVRPMTP